jgi:iron complex transport system ATP-binding protein
MEILELNNINFSYTEKDNPNNFSLSAINLKIYAGDFISVLGPNGCGKSTLLKLIANILKPTSGVTKIYGEPFSSIKRREFAKNVAFVPQNSGTNFPYSIYEIVMMGRSPYLNFLGIEDQIDRKLVLDTLDLLEISHLKNKGINEVSGGEAQRALIARAIVQNPKILLLDEPNSHLDIRHQLSIYNLLQELNITKNLTVVTISHDLNLSNYYSSRAILMNDGNILFDSIPEDILTTKNILEVFGIEAEIFESRESKNNFISLIS